jgi:hypothetical protein
MASAPPLAEPCGTYHPAAGRGHHVDGLGAGLLVQVAAEHRRALRRELERRGPAHAARGAADQRYLAV